jgi:hypothetical protein
MLAGRLANGELFRMVGREADTLLVMAVPGDGSLPSQTPGSSAHTPKTNTVMVLAICEVRHQAVIANGIATASHPPLPLDTRLRRAWASRLPLALSRVVARDGHRELKKLQ